MVWMRILLAACHVLALRDSNCIVLLISTCDSLRMQTTYIILTCYHAALCRLTADAFA